MKIPHAPGLLALLVLAAGPAASETLRFEGDRLTVRNLIGEVRVEGARGAGFEVEIMVGGRDASPDALRLDARADELDIVFPEGVREFVYPALRGGSNTEIRQEEGNRVKVRASGTGKELWADVTIRMPAGSRLSVEHGVGLVAARGVRGEVDLATRSGDVSLEDAEGRLAIATGSGDVALDRVGGEKLSVATGSGGVRGEAVDGDEIHVATGSGDVSLRDVRGREIHFATGSGDVEGRGVDANELQVGTGSGEVTLDLSALGDGKVSVGTGSGDIALRLPQDASVELHAETDGGRIAVDLDQEVAYRVREDDEVELTLGSGAARVRLGSGNGDIRIGR